MSTPEYSEMYSSIQAELADRLTVIVSAPPLMLLASRRGYAHHREKLTGLRPR